ISVQQAQHFTAAGTDQFGDPMTLGTLSWTASGGNVTGAGVFQSGTLGKGIRGTATDIASGKSGFALVDVINLDVSGSFGYPVPWKSTMGVPLCFTNIGTDAKIRVYSTSGRLVFNTEIVNAPDPSTQKCQFAWDTKNSSGEKVASGVYLYVI